MAARRQLWCLLWHCQPHTKNVLRSSNRLGRVGPTLAQDSRTPALGLTVQWCSWRSTGVERGAPASRSCWEGGGAGGRLGESTWNGCGTGLERVWNGGGGTGTGTGTDTFPFPFSEEAMPSHLCPPAWAHIYAQCRGALTRQVDMSRQRRIVCHECSGLRASKVLQLQLTISPQPLTRFGRFKSLSLDN